MRIAADPVVGLRWSKAPSSMGKISAAEVLRLRATNRHVTRSIGEALRSEAVTLLTFGDS